MWRYLLLTVHILAAAAWIGGGLYYAFSTPMHARESSWSKVWEIGDRMGNRYFGAAIGVLLLSGVGLVLMSEAFTFGSVFVLIGIGAIVVDGVLESAVFGPRAKRLAAAGGDQEAGYLSILRQSATVHFALIAFVVWTMVAKLGA